MLIRREGRRGTAVGEMSVKERGYVEEQGSASCSNSSSDSGSKSLGERWDGTSLFPFDSGKTLRALPTYVLSGVASLGRCISCWAGWIDHVCFCAFRSPALLVFCVAAHESLRGSFHHFHGSF